MKLKFSLIAAIISVFIVSCESDSKEKEVENKIEKVKSFENEDEFEDQIADIDNNTELSVINSLAYNNNEGSRVEAVAYLDKKDKEVKIEETFSDVKSGNYGKKTFYIQNGKKFATREVYFDNQLKTPSFVERLSFYDSKEKVIFTKERFSELEEELPELAYQIGTLKECSIDRTMRVLNQEGEFSTTFQGFASDGNLSYLLVGENTSDGYASSLAVQYKEGDVQKLMNNEKAMIGKPLEVVHQVMIDERGLKFQVLLSVKIK